MRQDDDRNRLTRPLGVSRVDKGYSHGYRVSFSHRGRRVTRFFSDKKCGGHYLLSWSTACSFLWRSRSEAGSPWKYQWNNGAKPPRNLRS